MANASMRDVAARAGVSVATVSHVINNTRYVAEGTRERVQAAIEELNYNPDTMARIFKTGRTNLVGFVVPNISDPFFSTLIEEVESVLSRQNYRLVVTNSHEDEQREIENLRFLCKQGAPLAAMEEVLQSTLIVYVSPSMRGALSSMYFRTPKWIECSEAAMQ